MDSKAGQVCIVCHDPLLRHYTQNMGVYVSLSPSSTEIRGAKCETLRVGIYGDLGTKDIMVSQFEPYRFLHMDMRCFL